MAVDLQKRAQNAHISLIKILEEKAEQGADLGDVSAQVIVACDYSGSMKDRYEKIMRGYTKPEVPDIAERLLGVAMSGLDDDNKVPWFMFDSQVYEPFIVEPDGVENCIENWAMIPDERVRSAVPPKRKLFGRAKPPEAPLAGVPLVRRRYGGTDYLVVIDAILEYIKENDLDAPGQPPILIAFITDGAPPKDQEQAIMDRLVEARKVAAFWQVIGLGFTPAFLKKLNKMGGGIDNVGLFEVADVITLSDADFYDQFLSEFFREWLPEARRLGITTK
jgi:vWA found in TerF C terminus